MNKLFSGYDKGKLVAVEYGEMVKLHDRSGEVITVHPYNPDEDWDIDCSEPFGSVYLRVDEGDGFKLARWIADCPSVEIAEVMGRALATYFGFPLWKTGEMIYED